MVLDVFDYLKKHFIFDAPHAVGTEFRCPPCRVHFCLFHRCQNRPSKLRVILNKKPTLKSKITLDILNDGINEICESLKDELIDDFASEIGKFFRNTNKIIDFTNNDKELNYETKNINRVASNHVKKNWNKKLNIIPGKKFLKELNKWLVEHYKVNFGKIELSSELRKDEIDKELKTVITSIDEIKDIKVE
ncbi:hypothetical protein N9O58_05685 [Flavobacteriaceae bacterium]|nr:hypothetical protein [Flavobacteriaceae bacterium]